MRPSATSMVRGLKGARRLISSMLSGRKCGENV